MPCAVQPDSIGLRHAPRPYSRAHCCPDRRAALRKGRLLVQETRQREVECGFLIVPEDHAKPDGPTLKLAVARFRSDSGSPAPDPIVYLEGGPGGSPLRSLMPQFDVYLSGLLKKRDLILFY